MSKLKSEVISTVKSGNFQYAIIESINYGLVTVRLGATGTGSRLTNLNIVGTAKVGDLVIVDYSTNVPYVRATQVTQDPEVALPLGRVPLEFPTTGDICSPYDLGPNECCGTMVAMNGGGYGTFVYINSGGGLSPAHATTIATAKVIGMSAGDGLVLVEGWARGPWSLSPGGYIFLSLVAGNLTQTKPSGEDKAITVLGIALTSSIIRFQPELVVVELLI